MMANIEWAGPGLASGGVVLAGLASALLYARKRKWPEAVLALLAGLSLAAMLAGLTRPGGEAGEVAISTDAASPDGLARALLAVPQGGAIVLTGFGLREAQWNDLPARPLRWVAPQGAMLRLDFPRTLPLGRSFTLTAHHTQAQPDWRLQLLAENGQLLAESGKPGTGAWPQVQASRTLALAWQPPLAETLLLQARLLDGAGKVVAQGPLPLQVTEPIPLQIVGRFGAPSFDARALNQLLTDSNALLDWQTTLGKGLSRSESARTGLTEPNAHVIDAAYFETLSVPARAALLAQTGQGVPLIILGGSAADAAVWQRELSLRLAPQSPATEKEDARQFSYGAEQLVLAPASLNPPDKAGEPWAATATGSRQRSWLWQRPWKKGKIVWVGVSDWHRYAISSPAALGQWWQSLLDQAAVGTTQKVNWQQPDLMPVAGLRTEVCALGMAAGASLHIGGLPATAWQARSAKAETVCAAFLPQQPGWLTLRSGDRRHRIYIHANSDWPLWQQALRHDATLQYAARLPDAAAKAVSPRIPLPSWPFALLLTASLLILWWRERR